LAPMRENHWKTSRGEGIRTPGTLTGTAVFKGVRTGRATRGNSRGTRGGARAHFGRVPKCVGEGAWWMRSTGHWGRGLRATAPGLKPARCAGFGDGRFVQKSSTPTAGYVLFGACAE